ncbi:rhomboid family intramembrane serine protease [Acinetobacter shaoyimingii]|uniref:Rhomboid family intramembrane serine protease n=1 Tax=Acinetobacter shaoyimingii TaxID=2715164 RepID=A0A6G8RTN3_9GAMM|nr:rhomboid family intramembrane serine protease [Acinetobacter shaoyimingii]QIO05274.1 rhomboid family intramembrane serine protease [Acinetobacter shaoyimingii]
MNQPYDHNNKPHQLNLPASQPLNINRWWITAVLIAINVALFSWQVLQGMNITQPSTLDAIHWGADYAPLTFLAEPIRLLTSMFFHFGLIHLMLNMWALYIFGRITEQLFGHAYFIGVYILSGLAGSLLSGYISIQDSYEMLRLGEAQQALFPSVGAGASGAVMGLGGALTVLALLPRLAHQSYYLDKTNLLMVMGLNIAMGFMISGINNAAHIGGMLMGACLSLIWYLGEKWQKPILWKIIGLIIGIVLCELFYQYCLHLVVDLHPFWIELVKRIT